jgi:hypothetical protein
VTSAADASAATTPAITYWFAIVAQTGGAVGERNTQLSM